MTLPELFCHLYERVHKETDLTIASATVLIEHDEQAKAFLADARRAALLEASEIAYKFCDTHAAHPKGCEIGDAILQRASEGV